MSYDISILVPIYCTTEQSLGWLDECLASAVVQDCNVVTYDDGSLIDVRPVVSKYNVSFLRHPINHGAAFARNRCAERANTELILPLDCDDKLKPTAIRRLLDYWDGVPVYPDVCKFGEVDVPHFQLLDFHCNHLTTHVGFTSVNVLHSKAQWKSIGGWDESIEFFEDGEYNARLLGTYCGVHCKEPLVDYRFHPGQRTVTYRMKSADYARVLIKKIRSYDMACPGCAKKRRAAAAAAVAGAQTAAANTAATGTRSLETVLIQSTSLPLEFEGKTLSQYVGGYGRGRHYYRGQVSKFPYRVVYGDLVYADPRDVRAESNKQNSSMLVKVTREVSQAPPAPAPVTETVPEPRIPEGDPTQVASLVPDRTPVTVGVVRTPVVEVEQLEEISKLSAAAILKMEMTPQEASKYLKLERDGLNRKKVVAYLESVIANG